MQTNRLSLFIVAHFMHTFASEKFIGIACRMWRTLLMYVCGALSECVNAVYWFLALSLSLTSALFFTWLTRAIIFLFGYGPFLFHLTSLFDHVLYFQIRNAFDSLADANRCAAERLRFMQYETESGTEMSVTNIQLKRISATNSNNYQTKSLLLIWCNSIATFKSLRLTESTLQHKHARFAYAWHSVNYFDIKNSMTL